jgi:hypothetical protein
MTRTVEVDAATLPAEQRDLVTGLIRSADFYALPPNLAPSEPGGADRFNYRITVESADGTHTVQASEAAVPESLAPLIDWLNRRQ